MKQVESPSPTPPSNRLSRYCLLSVLLWSAVIAGFAVWSISQAKAYIMEQTRQDARSAFERDLLVHRWSAGLGEVYLPLTEEAAQSASQTTGAGDIVLTETGKRLARIVPAGMTRHLFALQEENGGVESHLTSLQPRSNINLPDPWERAALLNFTAHGETEAACTADLKGEPYFRLMRPLMAEKSCLGCHGSKGYQLGDVIGGISVSIPMRRVHQAQAEQRRGTVFAMGSMWVVGLAVIGAAFSRIRFYRQARTATEKALRESEAEFRMLAENANDVIWTVDLTGKFTYVSPSVQRQMGYSQEEILQLGLQETLTLASRDTVRGRFDAAVADVVCGRPVKGQHLDLEHCCKDGSPVWFDVTFDAIYGPSGKFISFMGVSRNITARKATEAALRVSEEKYRSIFHSFQDIYYRTDLEWTVTEITPSVTVWGGYSQEECIGTNVSRFYADQNDRALMLQTLQETGTVHDYETRLKTKDGRIVETSLSARLLFDGAGRPTGVEGILRDITQRKQSEAKLRELALKDELTGLNNRRGFLTLAEQQMKGAARFRQHVALIYADLDKMKWINDNLGHEEGDRALVDTAAILRASFRSSDIIARFGGDEFVGLGVVQQEADGELVLARLREALEQHNRQEGRPYRLSISFGLAMYDPSAPCTLAELMERGDAVMYAQKMKRGSRRAAGSESPAS